MRPQQEGPNQQDRYGVLAVVHLHVHQLTVQSDGGVLAAKSCRHIVFTGSFEGLGHDAVSP